MKILKWISLFCSLLLFGQEDSLSQKKIKIEVDSLWYQYTHNSFSSNDELTLLGYYPLEIYKQL